MNEVFDIKRLGKLIQYEVVNYIPRFFRSLLIFASVIVAFWVLTLTIDGPLMQNGRSNLVMVLFTIAITLSPFIVYKDMNDRKKGYIYSMIPASTLEKLLSMVLLCLVIVPILSYAVLTGVDILLWLLSRVGIGQFLFFEFYNPFSKEYVFTVMTAENMCPVADTVLYFLNLVSYTIMFNTIFRKNKVLKTILLNIALTFLCVILTVLVADNTTAEFWDSVFEPLAEWLDDKTDSEIEGYMLMAGRCISLMFSALFLSITYFRIKRVNY